jgi:hypothetical protein
MSKVKVVSNQEDRANLDYWLVRAVVLPKQKVTPMMKKLTVAKKRVASHC